MNRADIERHFESYVDVLAPFCQTSEFPAIFAELKKQKAEGGTIVPESKDIFRCFKATKLEDLRVIIIGQDPYPSAIHANGLAFSVSKDVQAKIPASLDKIVESVEEDAYSGLNFEINNFDTSLIHWTEQGVMLLNAALTVGSVDGKLTPGSHSLLWRPFIKNFIETVTQVKKGLVIIACGTTAQDLVKDIPFYEHFVLNCEHPSNAAREKRKWNHHNCFSFTNAVIRANRKGELITW